MKNPVRFAVAILTLLTFLGTGSAVAQDTAKVRATVLGFSSDWNRHDMVAFGKLFAPDADFVNVSGTWWQGREAIQLNHSWLHGVIPENAIPGAPPAYYGIFKNSTLTFVDTHVRFLRKDVAIAHVNWELLGDARTPKRLGVLTFVLTRQNGGWLIAAAQNTEIHRVVH